MQDDHIARGPNACGAEGRELKIKIPARMFYVTYGGVFSSHFIGAALVLFCSYVQGAFLRVTAKGAKGISRKD